MSRVLSLGDDDPPDMPPGTSPVPGVSPPATAHTLIAVPTQTFRSTALVSRQSDIFRRRHFRKPPSATGTTGAAELQPDQNADRHPADSAPDGRRAPRHRSTSGALPSESPHTTRVFSTPTMPRKACAGRSCRSWRILRMRGEADDPGRRYSQSRTRSRTTVSGPGTVARHQFLFGLLPVLHPGPNGRSSGRTKYPEGRPGTGNRPYRCHPGNPRRAPVRGDR